MLIPPVPINVCVQRSMWRAEHQSWDVTERLSTSRVNSTSTALKTPAVSTTPVVANRDSKSAELSASVIHE